MAFGLLFFLCTQALAGNWVFEDSTDPSDGRKGVIIYKSPHFDTTPGAFARFIVLDDGTLNFRMRNDADGPITDSISIDFGIAVGDSFDFYFIYNPDYEAKADGCVAEWNTATACHLSCARSHESFGLGDEVACTTKSEKSLWFDFRAVLTAEHTEHILENYAKRIDGISFYAGSDAVWSISADDLMKHICEQTKARDHACRGEMKVAEASEPEQRAKSVEETSGWVKKNRNEFVNKGDGWNFVIEFDRDESFFGLYASLTTFEKQYGELKYVRLVKSEYDGPTSDYTQYFDLLRMNWFYDDDDDEGEVYTKAMCFWPTEGGIISILSCGVNCSSDEYCLEIGPRTDVSMHTEFPIDLLPNFINALESFDKILFQFDRSYIWEEIGDLPKLLRNREERSLIDILTKDGTRKAYDALKGAEFKLPSEVTREEACAVLQICDGQ